MCPSERLYINKEELGACPADGSLSLTVSKHNSLSLKVLLPRRSSCSLTLLRFTRPPFWKGSEPGIPERGIRSAGGESAGPPFDRIKEDGEEENIRRRRRRRKENLEEDVRVEGKSGDEIDNVDWGPGENEFVRADHEADGELEREPHVTHLNANGREQRVSGLEWQQQGGLFF